MDAIPVARSGNRTREYSIHGIEGDSTLSQTTSDSGWEMDMARDCSTASDQRSWRDLYRAALLEIDGARVPERIAEAEKALVVRARELFSAAGDNIEEEEMLDDAMYALHALRGTLKYRPTPAQDGLLSII